MSEQSEIFDIYALMNEHCVPYGVNLELTAGCNIDCRHCYRVITSGPEMDTAEVKRLLDDLAGLGTFEITITGGEPLLRNDFKEIILYAVKTGGFSVKLFSNLTLLDVSTADALASVPLNSVETTLLGPDAETHDMMARMPGSFDATVKAIALLKERGIRVCAKTVIMKPNADKIDEMYDLAHNLDIPFRHDDTVFIASDGGRQPLALQIPDCDIIRFRRRTGDDFTFNPSICNAGRSIMSISPDGTVYPCGAFPQKAGNIREIPLGKIWKESSVMNSLRSLQDEDYEACMDCEYLVRCDGCMAMGIGLASGRTVPCRFARKHLRHLT